MATPRLVNRGSHSENSTGGSFTFRVQTAAGSNHALLVRLYNRGNVASPTVTYNGDSVTLLGRDGSGTDNSARWAAMFVLVAPDDGDNTVSVSWGSGSASVWHCVVEHWCDVDQSTPNGAVYTRNTGSVTNTGSSLTVVDSASGDMCVDALAAADSMAVGTGQTRGPAYATPGAHSSYEAATGASTVMDWTLASATFRVGHVACALKGAAGAASVPTWAEPAGGNTSLILGTRTVAESVSTGASVYFGPSCSPEASGLDTHAPWPLRHAGEVGLIGLRVTANAATSASTLTLVEDGVDTSTVVTIPAGTTGVFESSVPLSVDGTSELHFRLTNGGGGTLSYSQVWITFTPTDTADTVTLLSSFASGSWTKGGGITEYVTSHGERAPGTTISQSTAWLPFDGTLANLHVTQVASMRSFSSTIDTLLDEATTAHSLTWASGETQFKSDIDTVSVTQGQRLQHRLTTGAGTGSIEYERLNSDLISDAGMFMLSCARGGGGVTLTNATDLYINVAGELGTLTTEAATQFEAPFAFTACRLWVDVQTNGQGGTTGDDAVITFRLNGADTSLQVRIPRGDPVRAYLDFHTEVAVAEGDLINLKARTNTSTGSLIINSIGIVGVSAGSASASPVGMATEADTALALAVLQALPVTAATETNTALALPATSVQSLVAALELDTATALNGAQALPVTAATETDTALALPAVSVRALALAVSRDTALALEPFTPGAVASAAEVDTALQLAGRQIVPLGLAVETSTALALSSALTGAVGLAAETSQALGLSAVQIRVVGLALQVDVALNPAQAALYVPPYALFFQSDLPPQLVFRSTLP